MRGNLHTHTTFSDGKNTLDEMIEAAIAHGMARIGISDHSFTPFDPDYCEGMQNTAAYQAAVRQAAKRYQDSIEVLCGIEQDATCGKVAPGFDYAIGSTHYLRLQNVQLESPLPEGVFAADEACVYASVDYSPASFQAIIDTYFQGDALAFAEAYFAEEAQVIDRTGATIVGHFDLITVFNEGGKFFDETHSRYVTAWQKAADHLLSTHATFEANYGAVLKGRRSVPYPAPAIQEYLLNHGATLITTTDAHCADHIAL